MKLGFTVILLSSTEFEKASALTKSNINRIIDVVVNKSLPLLTLLFLVINELFINGGGSGI
jgi:hypothetical protein